MESNFDIQKYLIPEVNLIKSRLRRLGYEGKIVKPPYPQPKPQEVLEAEKLVIERFRRLGYEKG